MSDRIIILFDQYSVESQLLHESFIQTGCECLAISLEENDFLPSAVTSVYDMISGDFWIEEEKRGCPRYFNEIAVPDNWSIHAGDKSVGNITYQHEEKGKIYYLQSEKHHLVEAVDWYDRKGCVRFRDHYNRYGNICARTVYDGNGKELCKSRFSKSGKEFITENFVTGDIILNYDDVMKIFRSKQELTGYWFNREGLGKNRIFYNSLVDSFFISNRLGGVERKDILFWQKSLCQDTLENMRMILGATSGRMDKIMVQKRSVYEKISEFDLDKSRVGKLGYIYSFKKENAHKPEAFIFTHSDKIEHCEELIQRFPQMHFHIAAITAMSSKLIKLENYNNVSLYPGAGKQVQDRLFLTCDYYFDINYMSEVRSAVYQAFLHNQLIFAFQETIHNKEYVLQDLIYPVAEFDRMVSDLKVVMEDVGIMEQRLKEQRKYALAESKETYVDLLGL